MMTDPIADMLTRIRNSNAAGKKNVSIPASRVKVGIAEILVQQGFIESYEVQPGQPASTLQVALKFGPDGEQVIRRIERVSKPGCRVYSGAKDLRSPLGGLGVYILSTPKGIVSDSTAREINTGGEVLCKVY
jgi:small subunit ribosomal protein S8